MLLVMLTWRRGSALLSERVRREELPLCEFLPTIEKKTSNRVQGTAVFLTSHPERVPTALMHNLKHNKILHQRNIIVSVTTTDEPRVDETERSNVTRLSDAFTQVNLRFGYMETPDVPRALMRRRLGLDLDVMQTSYYLSRRALRPATRSEMPRWQDRLFIWLARHSSDASLYFKIPTDRAIEVGTQVAI